MRTSRKARDAGYRSGSELRVAKQLEYSGIKYDYEPKAGKVRYTVPETSRLYLPDFILENGIIIEVKGLFTASDRKKHRLIKEQRPELDIRFVFDRARQKISKKSKTSYAMWCSDNDFLYAEKVIPLEWFDG